MSRDRTPDDLLLPFISTAPSPYGTGFQPKHSPIADRSATEQAWRLDRRTVLDAAGARRLPPALHVGAAPGL